jgi:hypothetical protein
MTTTIKTWFVTTTDRWLASAFSYALKRPAVQQTVVDHVFNTSSPIYKSLYNEIISREIHADDVQDLDRVLEEQLENFEVDANNVNGLEDAIQDHMNDFEIDADNVEGLNDKLQNLMEEFLEDDANIKLLFKFVVKAAAAKVEQ